MIHNSFDEPLLSEAAIKRLIELGNKEVIKKSKVLKKEKELFVPFDMRYNGKTRKTDEVIRK